MDDLNLDKLRIDPAKLKEARLEAGYKGAQVARKLRVHRQSIWSYENGDNAIPSDILLKIAALYKKPVEYFQTIEV